MQMQDWGIQEWFRVAVIWAVIFAIVGGIISQSTEGMSWNGFVAGLWKGIEWFFIVAVVILVLFGAWYGLMILASTLNS
jgi:hypothetical protein